MVLFAWPEPDCHGGASCCRFPVEVSSVGVRDLRLLRFNGRAGGPVPQRERTVVAADATRSRCKLLAALGGPQSQQDGAGQHPVHDDVGGGGLQAQGDPPTGEVLPMRVSIGSYF